MFLLQVVSNDNCGSTSTTRAPSIFQPRMSAVAATTGRSQPTVQVSPLQEPCGLGAGREEGRGLAVERPGSIKNSN